LDQKTQPRTQLEPIEWVAAAKFFVVGCVHTDSMVEDIDCPADNRPPCRKKVEFAGLHAALQVLTSALGCINIFVLGS
jgi:hypothetical protein